MQKVFLITGTRKGIGRDLAEYYLNLGHIVAGCSREKSTLQHPNYLHFELDVADEQAVIKMVRSIKKQYHKIDILLNNAGIASMNHILMTPYNTVQNIMKTNFFGSFLFLREVCKVMLKQQYGRVVNFTTVAVPLHLEGEAVYAASKSALVSLTEIAAREFGTFGITVNAIGPTPIKTDLIKNIPKEKIDSLLEKQAIKRFGTFGDISNVIDFFIDDKSDFITGQIVYLGGVCK